MSRQNVTLWTKIFDSSSYFRTRALRGRLQKKWLPVAPCLDLTQFHPHPPTPTHPRPPTLSSPRPPRDSLPSDQQMETNLLGNPRGNPPSPSGSALLTPMRCGNTHPQPVFHRRFPRTTSHPVRKPLAKGTPPPHSRMRWPHSAGRWQAGNIRDINLLRTVFGISITIS